MKNFNTLLFSLFLLLSYAQNAAAEEKTVHVSGTISGSENAPLENALITVINNNDTIYNITADAEGFYEFEVLVDFVSGMDPAAYYQGYHASMVFPNPVNNSGSPVIYYRTPEPGETPTLQIIDLQGRELSPPYELSAGIYFYRLVFNNISTPTRSFSVTEPSSLEFELVLEGNNGGNNGPAALKYGRMAEPIEGDTVRLVVSQNGYETETRSMLLDKEQYGQDFQLTTAQPPIASIDVSGNLLVGEPVSFDATASIPGYNEELTYTWTINGQPRGGLSKISQIFMKDEVAQVTLKVYGKYGTVAEVNESYPVSLPAPSGNFAEVLGQVYSVSGDPLDSVEISVHGRDTTYLTNRDGEIGLSNVPTGTLVPLRLEKEGYAAQYLKVQIAAADSQAYFEAHMLARDTALQLEAIENGGELTGPDGVKVILPPGGMVDKTGTEVTGTINVWLTPVDVSDSAEYFAFPGSFSGLTPEGLAELILSYGTAEFYFEQNGQKLALAAGKTATVEIPVYLNQTLEGEDLQPGDEIPLWSMDPSSGTWLMEGYGTIVASEEAPTGLAFRGNVQHFSWWNCDIAPDPFYPELFPQVGSAPGGNAGGPEPGSPMPITATGQPIGPYGAPRGAPRNTFVPAEGIQLPFPPGQEIRIYAFGNNGLYKGTKDVIGGAGETPQVIIDLYPVFSAEGDNFIAPDTIVDAAIDSIGDVDRFIFEADSGFVYNISVASSSGSNLKGTVQLRDADNLPLFSKDFGNGAGFIAFNSDKDGKHYIVVDGTENEPGGYTIALRKVNQIALNSYLTDNLLGAGDLRQYAFEASAGQLVNLSWLAQNFTGRIYLRLFDTEGNTLYDRRNRSFVQTGVVRLPQSGVYTAEVYAVDSYTVGDFFLGLSVIDDPIQITPDEPWIDVQDSLEFLSNLRYYSFEAARGDVLNFAIAAEDSLSVYAKLYSAGDEFFEIDREIYGLRTTNYNSSYQQDEASRLASLPDTGMYYIEIQPWGNQMTNFSGKYRITLFNPVNRPLEADVEVRDSIEKAFHFHKYALSFPEETGVVVRSINEDFSSYLYTSLFDTSATRYAIRSERVSSSHGSAAFELPPVVLNGDFILEQNPTGPSSGHYTFKVITLDDPVDLVSTAPYTEVEGRIDEVGERDYYQFTGDSGQIVSIDLLVPDTSFLRGSFRVYAMDGDFVTGQTLRDDYYGSSNADIETGKASGITLMLPYDSTYIIEVDGRNTLQPNQGYGSYTLRFNKISSAATINVDDDNAEYADAVTGFVRSATRAVEENGTVIVHPGTYDETLEVKIIRDGVTLQGSDAENTRIGSSAYSTVNIEAIGAVIENLQFDPARYRAITSYRNGDRSVIRNNIIRGGGDGMEFNTAHRLEIYDNVVDVNTGGPAVEVVGDHTVFRDNQVNRDPDFRADNGVILRGNQIMVKNNVIGDNASRNISFTALYISADTATIVNNVLNNYVTGINVNPRDDDLFGFVTVSGNTLGNVTGSNGGNSDGIRISRIDSAVVINNYIKAGSDLSRGFNLTNSGGLVYNNRITVKRFRPFYYYYQESDASPELIVANNTFVNQGTYAYTGGVYFSSSEAAVNVRFLNNIITAPVATSTDFCAIESDRPILMLDYNLINGYGANYCGSAAAGPNDLLGDPMLNVADLTLSAGSPAVDAGTSQYAPPVDFQGNARNDGNIDIGADEM